MRNVAEKAEFACFQQWANLPQKWPRNLIFRWVDQVILDFWFNFESFRGTGCPLTFESDLAF